MIRASNSTTYGLGAALAAFALVAPAATPVIAQEVRAAAETNCSKVSDKDHSRCIIDRHQQRMDEFARKTQQAEKRGAEADRRGEQAMIITACANYLRDNMGKSFTKEKLMAWLGNPKSKEEFRARMDAMACEIAKGKGYTGRTAQLDAQPQ